MDKKLAGKVALVSGASKGIGAAIARHLAAAGAQAVVGYASSKAGADKTVADIEAAGGKAHAVQGDFSKAADVERVFAGIQRDLGRLDILVNNAGVYAFGAITDLTPEFFHRQFDLNVLGTLLAIKHAVPLMREGGAIINIGSVVGKTAPATSTVYAASKGAIDTITVALSKELGPRKIRVNAINPGMVVTEGAQEAGMTEGEFREFMLKTTPLGRLGLPDDIARIAAFLASDDAFWINGQQIAAAGGQTM